MDQNASTPSAKSVFAMVNLFSPFTAVIVCDAGCANALPSLSWKVMVASPAVVALKVKV